ncbi:MAG: hypothetical protein ACLQNG_12455 [Acidimicrobiales bacterium]|jgi:hypothetical protein
MFGREHLVERRCKACGAAWLLTREQAHLSTRRPHLTARGTGIGPGNFQSPEQFGAGLDLGADTDALLLARDLLASCPKCQLQDFTDRRVTDDDPASADASRAALP